MGTLIDYQVILCPQCKGVGWVETPVVETTQDEGSLSGYYNRPVDYPLCKGKRFVKVKVDDLEEV